MAQAIGEITGLGKVRLQGDIVWMALAIVVKTRLWRAGAVREQRDMTLI